MKLLASYFLVANLLFINSQHLRNLILTRDPEKYNVLTKVGKETFKQLNKGIEIDFKDLNNAQYVDEKASLYIVVNEYDEEIPEQENFSFEINNGEPDMSSISTSIPDSASDIDLEIFGKVYNVRDQLKAMENMIAAGFGQYSGTVVIYNQANEKASQKRYKCFVRDNEKSYGSFEIIQEDKNDSQVIETSSTSWWSKVKGVVKEGLEVVKICGEAVSLFVGITKDIKSISFSSFLRIPFLSLFVIIALF